MPFSPWRGGLSRFIVLTLLDFFVRSAEQCLTEHAVLVEHGDCFLACYALRSRQNDRHRMLARPPFIGTSTEVLEAPLYVDPDRGGIPFAAGNPRGKNIVLSAGKLVDSLHIALAPIENLLTGPVV